MSDSEGTKMATVYVSVPPETRIADDESKEDCHKLASLLSKHGYKLSYFAHDDITFYDVNKVDEYGFVPIDSRYCMSRREFSAFLHLIRKLDAAEKKASELMLEWAAHSLESSR